MRHNACSKREAPYARTHSLVLVSPPSVVVAVFVALTSAVGEVLKVSSLVAVALVIVLVEFPEPEVPVIVKLSLPDVVSEVMVSL